MMSQLKESYAVTELCQAFGVHRSSYKYWVKRSQTINAKKLNEQLLVEIIFSMSNGSGRCKNDQILQHNEGHR